MVTSLTQVLLWCAAGILILIDFHTPTGEWSRLAILVGAGAITRSVVDVGIKMRRSFDTSIGRA